jgi:hypothetical protein
VAPKVPEARGPRLLLSEKKLLTSSTYANCLSNCSLSSKSLNIFPSSLSSGYTITGGTLSS